jgi:hypothetical protein
MPGIDERREGAPGHRFGIALRVLERGLDLTDLPAQLVLRERGLGQHLGDEIEAQRKILREHAQGDGGAVPATPAAQAPSHRLDGAIDLGATPAPGAPGEQ